MTEKKSLIQLGADVKSFVITDDLVNFPFGYQVAQVVSQKWWDKDGEHSDKWGLARIWRDRDTGELKSERGIIVEPNTPLFTALVTQDEALNLADQLYENLKIPSLSLTS